MDWTVFAGTAADDQALYEKALEQVLGAGTKVSIEIPAQQLKESNKYTTIPCKATFGSYVEECVVACGHFSKIRSVLNGSVDTVNLLDYIPQLVPKLGKQVSLVTYQNGILNSVEEFRKKGELILSNFPEGALCIGLYNPQKDLVLSLNEVAGYHLARKTLASCMTRLFFSAIIQKFNSVVPLPVWVHVAHSQGAGVISRALYDLSFSEIRQIRQHLIVLTYGATMPIPKSLAMLAYNTYSDGDNAAFRFSKVKPAKDYHIEIVESQDPPKSTFPPGDHAFDGKTYQEALGNDARRIKRIIKENNGISEEQRIY